MQPLIPNSTYHIYNHANGFENVFREEENYRFFMTKYQLYILPIAETYAYCLMPNHFHLVVRIRKRETIETLIRNKNNSLAGPTELANSSSENSSSANSSKVPNFGRVNFSNSSSASPSSENPSKVPNFGRVDFSNFSSVNVSSANSSSENPSKVPNFGRVNVSNYSSENPSNENPSKVPNFGRVDVSNVSIDSEIEKFLSKQFANLFSSYTQSFNKVYGRMGSLFVKNFKRELICDKTHFLNAVVYTHRNPIHHGFCKGFEEWPYSSYNKILYGVESIVETEKLLKTTGGIAAYIEMHETGLHRLESMAKFDIP